ncbi:hypothetical protein E2C01_091661 [Portunus trituberculatus]|uniref:Uncharacterized protein n=1 Tax=Portunus trituberculatus TaxID=210409 RepID=A0A5B7JPP1_PORTR|nr:hypothetical protein [Portunus trituberculatus]
MNSSPLHQPTTSYHSRCCSSASPVQFLQARVAVQAEYQRTIYQVTQHRHQNTTKNKTTAASVKVKK